jgi:hypothetical protein
MLIRARRILSIYQKHCSIAVRLTIEDPAKIAQGRSPRFKNLPMAARPGSFHELFGANPAVSEGNPL